MFSCPGWDLIDKSSWKIFHSTKKFPPYCYVSARTTYPSLYICPLLIHTALSWWAPWSRQIRQTRIRVFVVCSGVGLQIWFLFDCQQTSRAARSFSWSLWAWPFSGRRVIVLENLYVSELDRMTSTSGLHDFSLWETIDPQILMIWRKTKKLSKYSSAKFLWRYKDFVNLRKVWTI